jgi:phospholipid/cholesterol/gamma-HCH transport system ATP-binding protein
VGVIEVDNVFSSFGEQRVHAGVSFSISAGTLVALIGGSGSGKSVLLREMIGLRRPDSGTVRVLGTDMWADASDEVDAVRRRIGVLFQDGALWSSLTVAQNVAAPMREHERLPPRLVRAQVRLRLAQAGLPLSAANKLPSELSGGMRKRAALARALALEPQVLFLDEPTSGLDPITARAFDTMMRGLVDDLGITVFIVTHDLDTLLGAVDRVIVLAQGRVRADGPVREVMHVDDPWVRGYFAVRTMLEGGDDGG